MNVASLELSKELHKLSGWQGEGNPYHGYEDDEGNPIPYFTLGYLLRKLNQARVSGRLPMRLTMDANGVGYSFGYEEYLRTNHEETPEDAAAELAIKLFKRGLLRK